MTPAGLIVAAGDFTSPDGTLTLTVAVESGLVRFEVVDQENEQVASGGGFSDFHRWFFYWDQKSHLWSYNSDMGPLAVWMRGDDGHLTMSEVATDSPLPAELPKAVRDYLPSSILRRLDGE